jgi:hypothetical protein
MATAPAQERRPFRAAGQPPAPPPAVTDIGAAGAVAAEALAKATTSCFASFGNVTSAERRSIKRSGGGRAPLTKCQLDRVRARIGKSADADCANARQIE